MELCLEAGLTMPANYVVMDEDEMCYVDGGGTITITLTKGTIQGCIGTISGVASASAIQGALDALGGTIATAVELGTAGAGTLAVGAFLLAWNGMAAGLATTIASSVIGNGAGKLYRGGNQTVRISAGWIPFNFSKSI